MMPPAWGRPGQLCYGTRPTSSHLGSVVGLFTWSMINCSKFQVLICYDMLVETEDMLLFFSELLWYYVSFRLLASGSTLGQCTQGRRTWPPFRASAPHSVGGGRTRHRRSWWTRGGPKSRRAVAHPAQSPWRKGDSSCQKNIVNLCHTM